MRRSGGGVATRVWQGQEALSTPCWRAAAAAATWTLAQINGVDIVLPVPRPSIRVIGSGASFRVLRRRAMAAPVSSSRRPSESSTMTLAAAPRSIQPTSSEWPGSLVVLPNPPRCRLPPLSNGEHPAAQRERDQPGRSSRTCPCHA